MISLTISREGDTDLVIGHDPAEALWIDEQGLGRPGFSFRKEFAPESSWVAGRQPLSAVLDVSELPVQVYARGASTAALEATMATLEAAVSQWSYTVTLTIDGVAHSYSAECTWPQWGPVDSGEVRAHLARAALSIPVNPPGA